MAVKQTSSGSSIQIGHLEGRNIRVGHGLRPRQPLVDHRISDRLAMSYESKPESGTRRIYLAEGNKLVELEVAKGLESKVDLAGHKIEVGDGQLYVDDRRFDFERGGFVPSKTTPRSGGLTPAQQLDNLKKRFPDAKFIGDASNLSSIVIEDGVKIKGTVHLNPGLELKGKTFVGENGVVTGGDISNSRILGRVDGGVLDLVEVGERATVTAGVLTKTKLGAGAKVSGGVLNNMRLEQGAQVSGGYLNSFTLKAGQKIAGGQHLHAQAADTEKLRAAAGTLKRVDREDAQAALQALQLGLDEAQRFEANSPHDRRVRREVKGVLGAQVSEATALLQKLEGAKSQAEVDALMSKLDGVAEKGSEAITRLRKQATNQTGAARTPLSELGIDPEVFQRYVQSTLLQLGPMPEAAPVGPAQRPMSYSEALFQMQHADLMRAYQPAQTGYPPQAMQSYGQFQMPQYLFGPPQPSPQVMTTVPPQYPQQPSGWGKAAMLGGAGLLLGMGLGSFGMGTFGLGMGMLPMMMGMGGMGMMGMGMGGMGMFGF